MKIYQEVVSLLTAKTINFREIVHAAEGQCEVVSKIRGNELSQAMKAIVLMAKINKKDRKYYLAVLPGDRAIDMNVIKRFARANEGVMFAPKDRAEQLTGCVMGSVPPFTFNPQLELIVDPSIRENSEIVFNAGTLDRSIFMSVEDYISVTNPNFLNFVKDSAEKSMGKLLSEQHKKVFSAPLIMSAAPISAGESMTINPGLKLIGIGAFGRMLSPSAKHLSNSEIAKYTRVLDRHKVSFHHDNCRSNWSMHGATLVNNYEALVGDGDFDGVVICAGKNGDDYAIFERIIPLLYAKNRNYFILHLSTVSIDFVKLTYDYCKSHNVEYANYPLTGGVVGAESAKMLILGSGDEILFEKVRPMLMKIGNPKYFGKAVERAAEVKLMGHIMLFNNLVGISSAIALHTKILERNTPEADQVELFNFLNDGAGGSRQWELTLRKVLEHNDWSEGFLLKYAVVDILYAIQLMLSKDMPAFSIFPLLELSLVFSSILATEKDEFSMQYILSAMLKPEVSVKINQFIQENLSYQDVNQSFHNCINSLPEDIKQSVMPNIFYTIQNPENELTLADCRF